MSTIAALYVAEGGTYTDLPGVDAWTETRDARLYDGPHPVVAHPPCARWSVLAYSVRARYGYQIGDDGGCFAHALETVRRCGGVLEHPARSLAFGREHGFNIGQPRHGSWQLTLWGDWLTQVSQAAYGHPADKLTWLLYRGTRPPPQLDWSTPKTAHQVSYGKKSDATGDYWKEPLTTKEAKATPLAFRDLLIDIARLSVD